MRIRRCLSAGLRSNRLRTRRREVDPPPSDPDVAQLHSSPPEHWPALEPHPKAVLRQGLGGFKYTSRRVSRSRTQWASALKIYSNARIDHANRRRLFATAYSAQISDRHAGIDRTLSQMLAVAAKTLDSHNAVRDVHVQLQSSSRAAAVDSIRKSRLLRGDEHLFNAILCMHRPTELSSVLGRPLVQLGIAAFRLQTACTIKSGSQRWHPLVELSLSAHLRPKFLAAFRQGTPLGTQKKGVDPTLERLLTAFVGHAKRSVPDGTYADANEVLTKIRDSLRQWLPESGLTTFVEPNDLEVVLRNGDTGSRYVSNTFIDAGTHNPTRLATRAIRKDGDSEQADQAGSLRRRLRVLCIEKQPPSGQLSVLSGKILATLVYESGARAPSLQPSPEQVIHMFRVLGKNAGQHSLSSHAQASRALSKQLPLLSEKLEWKYASTDALAERLTIKKGSKFTLGFNVNPGLHDGDLQFDLPTLQLHEGHARSHLHASRVKVSISARTEASHSSASSSSTPTLGPGDELEHIASMSATVLRRVWSELVMDSYQMAAQTMAEALLRIVEFTDKGVEVSGVAVTLQSPDGDPSCLEYQGLAWNMPSNDAEVKHAWEYAPDALASHERGEASDGAAGDLGKCSDVRITQSGEPHLRCRSSTSVALQKLLGLRELGFSITWNERHAGSMPAFDAQGLLQGLENAVSREPRRGMHGLRSAYMELAQLEPRPKVFQLFANTMPVPTTIPKEGGTPNAAVLRVILQGTADVNQPQLTLRISNALKTYFTEALSVISFDVMARATLKRAESSMPPVELARTIISVVEPEVRDKAFDGGQRLAQSVADVVYKASGELAAVLTFEDVGVRLNESGKGRTTYWASKTLDGETEKEDGQTSWAAGSPQLVPGAGRQPLAQGPEEDSQPGIASRPGPLRPTTVGPNARIGLLRDDFRPFQTASPSGDISEYDWAIHYRSKKVSATNELKIDSVRDAVEQAIRRCTSDGTFGLCEVWQQLASLHPAIVEPRTRFIGPQSTSTGVPEDGETNWKYLRWTGLKVNIFGSSSDGVKPAIVVSLPLIPDLPFAVEELSLPTKDNPKLGLQLRGRPGESNDRTSFTTLSIGLQHLCASLLRERIFSTLDRMLRAVCVGVMSHVRMVWPSFELVSVRAFYNPPLAAFTKGYSEGPNYSMSVSEYESTEIRDTDEAQQTIENDRDAPSKRPVCTMPTLIALGSNVGDRLSCIEEACRALDADPDIRIVKTSSLYETKAMYVEDQAPFLNGVCQIETTLSPEVLLNRTQAIEQQLGRVKTIDKGPRNIDLDILLYGDHVMKTDRLTIPHPLMLERQFVLHPMFDLLHMRTLKHPVTGNSLLQHSITLGSAEPPMFSTTPLAEGVLDLRPRDPKRPTAVMSILNVTPDSFSDGGDNATTDADRLKDLARDQIAGGATIIDVGGQSSRPNAPDVTAGEEIRRVLPAIEAIKSLPEAVGVAISVDTYRAAVAEAAINAGAHIINDISAGLLDPEMLPTVARLGCTYIMMHMRGTPATMQSEENTSYPDGLIPTIRRELSDRVTAAQAAGVRRWRIILDPGIGFSKTTEQNLEILRHMRRLEGFMPLRRIPWLVGSSRKGFIGKITGVTEPKERSWGTATTVVAAVQGGADVVRVHDVEEMAAVAKMADAIYKEKRIGERHEIDA